MWALAMSLLMLVPMRRAEAYPISPVSLWSLTERAELVVWADVEAIEPAPASGDDDPLGGASVARLRIREAWKGQAPKGERLGVTFHPSVICPAPPRYEPGHAVVAFLVRQGETWWTAALSYGTRYPADAVETEAYRQAVTRAHRAQVRATQPATGSPKTDLEQGRLDWLVFVATQPALRWDGLYDLVPQADTNHFFYDRSPAQTAPSLTQSHREQLADSFVKHPPNDQTLPMLLAVLRGHKNTAVDAVAASALESVFQNRKQAPPDWTGLALDLLRERLGEKPVKPTAPLEDPLQATASGDDASDLGQRWERFKQRHHLKPLVQSPPPHKPLVPGTGGDTPP